MKVLWRFVKRYFEALLLCSLLLAALVQHFVTLQSQSLKDIHQSAVLRVLMSDDPETQYSLNDRRYGFEYKMLELFAQKQGLELQVKVVPYAELFTLLNTGVADLAAGGILDTAYVQRVSQPTIPWYKDKTTIVYRRGTKRPLNLEQLGDESVLASSRYYGVNGFSELPLSDDYRSEYALLSAVASGEERYALSTNFRAKNAKHYLPNLNRSFVLPNQVSLVWALPKKHEPQLLATINAFLEESIEQKIPSHLAESYLNTTRRLNTYDILHLQERIKDVLPKFEYAFQRAARRGNIDWYMLAAMGYQESKWSNDARSPTGVRGIMQLTEETADYLGVNDRMDMTQSINAAARYVMDLKARLPDSIAEPDRTWFAVASYNLGYKHVINAYRLACKQGNDCNKWQVVAKTLPNLYGKSFQQGKQAKYYVERVQILTDILRFYDNHQRQPKSVRPATAVMDSEVKLPD